jgi:hypothetical protein
MLVFTGADPSLQQANIYVLTNSSAMKLLYPLKLGSILFQEPDF